MKRFILTAIAAAMLSLTASAQSIERDANKNGEHTVVTSSVNLFSDCDMRMCYYSKAGKEYYGLELDLTDRVTTVSAGCLLTIELKSGEKITLTNVWDTKATETTEVQTNTQTEMYSHTVPVRAWRGVRMVPVTGTYTHDVQDVKTTSFAQLYYIITPAQIETLSKGEMKQLTIITDQGKIEKKAKPLPEAVASLYPVLTDHLKNGKH